MITTPGYGVSASTVIERAVRDVYLFGNQGMPDHPFVQETELEIADPVCHAIAVDGDGATVSGCKIFDFRGDGITVRNSASPVSRMIRIPRVASNKISHCWTGIRTPAPDTQVAGNRVGSCRDYGLYVPQDAGAVQSEGNHFFGMTKAIFVESAESFHSTNDVFSDAAYGLHLTGYANRTLVTNGYSQHCWERNIRAESIENSFVNCSIRVGRNYDDMPDEEYGVVGVDICGRGNQFLGGQVVLSDYTFPLTANNMLPIGSTAFLLSGDGYSGFPPANNVIRTVVSSATFEGMTGQNYADIAVRIKDVEIGPINGNIVEIEIPIGFYRTSARLLVVDEGAEAKMYGNTTIFRGRELGNAVSDPEDFVDIGGSGLPMGSNNLIQIINTATGDSVTLSEETTY